MALPLDSELERERLKRRRAVADAQIAASMSPSPVNTQFIDFASPLAKVAQAYFGGQEQQKVDTEEKDLGARVRQDTTNAISDYTRKVTPRAAVASALTEDASGNAYMSDEQPAYSPSVTDKQTAAFELMGKMGGDPRDTGKLIVANALKGGDFAKIDPKDYTPESLAAYRNSGDASVLRPRVKAEFVNGQAVDPYATVPGTVVPPAPTEIERELLAAGLVRGSPEWTKAMSDRVAKQTTHAPGTQVNVDASTGRRYGEQFAGQVATQDVGMLDAARKAPELATRANQVKEVLASGKVITGAAADYRLAFGKALNLAGATDAETIANTETLSVNLARNTLDAIKASGLGSGSGFSNADRDFLEKAAGGKITLEAATIGRLADLSHRAASLSADAWNKRVKDIPDAALEGTGIRRDPITVSPLFGARSAAPQLSPEAQRYLDAARAAGGQ